MSASIPTTTIVHPGNSVHSCKENLSCLARSSDRPELNWNRPLHPRSLAGQSNLNATRSETEQPEPLPADLVGRVDRLHLAEIGDRLGAAAQLSKRETAVVVG